MNHIKRRALPIRRSVSGTIARADTPSLSVRRLYSYPSAMSICLVYLGKLFRNVPGTAWQRETDGQGSPAERIQIEVALDRANHRCYCRYAAESSSASKRQSQQGACLAKIEPRAPRHERRRVTIADVAEKIRLHMSFREKLLLAGHICQPQRTPHRVLRCQSLTSARSPVPELAPQVSCRLLPR